MSVILSHALAPTRFHGSLPMGASISDQSLRAMERYTHGHAASVVSQHGARTVEDSAQFLLPFLRPHVKLLDVPPAKSTVFCKIGLLDESWELTRE